VVSGLNYGADLSGLPIIGTGGAPLVNLAYAAQLTPQRPIAWPALRALAARHPVIITEWEGGAATVGWAEQTAQTVRALCVGWVAAHWNGQPPLVTQDANRPTPFGAVVRRLLSLEDLPTRTA
jgi:hypothetical protein